MVQNKIDCWISFCISTYKRPQLLKKQIELLLSQTFKDFEIVISDNDPDKSAKEIISIFNDKRVKYFANEENLGMVKSFNKSIERAISEYIVMVTDDDPVFPDMLERFYQLVNSYPGYPVYLGCKRTGKNPGQIEVFDNMNFTFQLLNPKLTSGLLWSSGVMHRKTILHFGGMPDYGSPHLADHAMLALCSSEGGGVMINEQFSSLTLHKQNFSKTNFNLYYTGCQGFYSLLKEKLPEALYKKGQEDTLALHISRWFFSSYFLLSKYFLVKTKDRIAQYELKKTFSKIINLPFMSGQKTKFLFEKIVFNFKLPLYIIKHKLILLSGKK